MSGRLTTAKIKARTRLNAKLYRKKRSLKLRRLHKSGKRGVTPNEHA